MNTMPRTLLMKTYVLNPSCIDLFITNSALSFQNTIAISNGVCDFHKMVIIVMKKSKYFDQTKFKNNLNQKLSKVISNYE